MHHHMAKMKRKPWKKEEVSIIIKAWQSQSAKEIAHRLGRKPSDVYAQVFKLKSVGFRMPKRNKANKTQRMLRELGITV